MSAQANKTLVRLLFDEVWNHNDLEVAQEIADKDCSSIENLLDHSGLCRLLSGSSVLS
jgi:hypothetical protein